MIDSKYFSAITEYDEARTFAEQREEGREEGVEEGIEIGREVERNQLIENMRKAGFTEEQIKLALGNHNFFKSQVKVGAE